MLKYGIWEDWDEAQRAIASKETKCHEQAALVTMSQGEEEVTI
jgi:hypothetical protein